MRGQEIMFLGNQLTVDELHTGPMVVVIDKGKAKIYKLPPHGKTIVTTYKGYVPGVEFTESEEF